MMKSAPVGLESYKNLRSWFYLGHNFFSCLYLGLCMCLYNAFVRVCMCVCVGVCVHAFRVFASEIYIYVERRLAITVATAVHRRCIRVLESAAGSLFVFVRCVRACVCVCVCV